MVGAVVSVGISAKSLSSLDGCSANDLSLLHKSVSVSDSVDSVDCGDGRADSETERLYLLVQFLIIGGLIIDGLSVFFDLTWNDLISNNYNLEIIFSRNKV